MVFTRPVRRQGLRGGMTHSRSHSRLVADPSVGWGTTGQREKDFQMQQSPWGCPLASWQVTFSQCHQGASTRQNSRLAGETTSVFSRLLCPQEAPGNPQPGVLTAPSLLLGLSVPACSVGLCPSFLWGPCWLLCNECRQSRESLRKSLPPPTLSLLELKGGDPSAEGQGQEENGSRPSPTATATPGVSLLLMAPHTHRALRPRWARE